MTMTYASLTAQVSDYIERSDNDTLSQIPNFIYLAQQRISRESKNLGLEIYGNGNFTPGLAFYQKPANWRRNISFNYGTGTGFNTRVPIELRSYEYLNAYWPDRTITSAPLFYSDYGYSGILVAPTPDLAYPWEWSTLQLPTPLSALNQTNWLTDFAPDVLLYASIVEAIHFLKNYESIPMWEEKYNKALSSLNGQDDMRIDDRQTDRRAD